MGMFGNSGGVTPYVPPQHSLPALILNALGRNVLGVDYLGRQDRLQALGNLQRANAGGAELLGPVQGAPTQAPVANSDGQDITDAFGPQMVPGAPRQRTAAEVASGLARLSMVPGFNAESFRKLAEFARPEMQLGPDNIYRNKYDGGYGGQPLVAVDKGQLAVPGGPGRPEGVQNAPGAVNAVAQMAGATTGAQEEQKAAYDLVDVPLGNGAVAKLPRAIAIPLLAKSAMRMAGGQGAPGAPGGDAGQGAGGAAFGVTPTPAETELSKNRAVTQGDLEKSLPASQSALHATDNLIQQYTNQVQNILGETYDPKTGKWSPTRGAKPQVNGWSTGRLFGHIPELTGQATNLEASLDGLRALISSEKMGEVRQDSQGASNNLRLTQGEIFNIFGNLAGPLHQTQDAEALKGVLRDSVNRLRQSQSTMHTQYDQQYNQIQRPTPGSTQPIPPRMGQGGRAPTAPQPGQVVKGYRFLGGNPADPKSWAKN